MTNMTVQVPKKQLFDVLYTNRQNHEAAYKESSEGYRQTLLSQLANILSDLKIGKDVQADLRRVMMLPKPKSYSTEYGRVLKMLELHTGETMAIDEDQFKNYIEDDWSWSDEFAASTRAYKR